MARSFHCTGVGGRGQQPFLRSEGFLVWGSGGRTLSSPRVSLRVVNSVPMGKAAKPLLFEGFQAGCHVILHGTRGALWNSNLFDNVPKVSKLEDVSHEMLVLLRLRVSSRVSGILDTSPCLWGKLQNLSFSKVSKQVVMSFCVARVALCDIPTCFIPCRKCQNWRMSCTKCSFCCPRVSSRASGFLDTSPCLWGKLQHLLSCRFAWQAWHFVTFQPVLYRVEISFVWLAQQCTPHFTPYTSHSTLYTPQSTLHTLHSTLHHTLHFTLYTLHTPHSSLHTLHSTLYITLHHFTSLYTLHFTLYTLHSTLHTLHFTLHIHSTLYTFHSTLHTPHFTLHTPHSTWHSTLHTPHFTHCALHTPHFTLHTPHSSLHTLHSTLHTPPHSTLYTHHTPHSTLYTPHSCARTLGLDM